MTKKEEAIQFIQSLPDDVSTIDILESLLVKNKIEKGISDMENGRVISHEDLKERLQEWRKSNGH